MTSAGAKMSKKRLQEATPRTNHKDVKYGHQDNVMSQGLILTVKIMKCYGWVYKRSILLVFCDGNRWQHHFVDNARRASADDVFKAEKKVCDELVVSNETAIAIAASVGALELMGDKFPWINHFTGKLFLRGRNQTSETFASLASG